MLPALAADVTAPRWPRGLGRIFDTAVAAVSSAALADFVDVDVFAVLVAVAVVVAVPPSLPLPASAVVAAHGAFVRFPYSNHPHSLPLLQHHLRLLVRALVLLLSLLLLLLLASPQAWQRHIGLAGPSKGHQEKYPWKEVGGNKDH